MIRADVWLPDPASVLEAGAFDAGALIRLERSDDDGENYAEIATIPVVATTVLYEYWDADGDTSSLYRWRVSDADESIFSDYSAPFAGTSPVMSILPVSYASLNDALALFETPPTSPARLTRLGKLLGVATDQLIDEFRGRDYFRHPTTGTETWTLDTLRHSEVLHCHDGLVTVTTVEISTDRGVTYTELDAGDWELRGQNPWSTERIPTGEPYFHVFLTGIGQRTFPQGVKAVRLTGARGWSTIPTALVEATAQRARQLMDAEASYSGSDSGGLDQFGRPSTTDRFWPQSLWNFIKTERDRFRVCVAAPNRPSQPVHPWSPWSSWWPW